MAGGAGRLGIDFGTSNTVAVVAVPGRAPVPLLFDGSPLLRSAVCLDTAGRLLAGRDALHLALALPESFEPYPKRCIDDGEVLLGERPVAVPALIAAVLSRVVGELPAPVPPSDVVLTYPAAWGSQRRGVLLAGASQVLPAVRLVPEPVAAASYFASVAGHQVPLSGHAVVFDLGAGTFDVSLLRNTATGFEVVANEGLPDAGGLDIDAAVVAHIERTLGARDAALWARLARPQVAGDRRASRLLWSNVQSGKEMLTRTSLTMIHVPLFDAEIALGRDELDALAAPIIARTVATTRATLRHAGIPETDLTAVFLVGGGSRMPAVGTALHRALGLVPTVVPQPELAVAEGSLLVPVPSAGAAATGAQPVVPGLPVPPWLPAPAVRSRTRWRWPAVAGAAVALAGLITAIALSGIGRPGRTMEAVTAGSSGGRPSASPAASPSPVDPCLLGTWRSTNIQQAHTIDKQTIEMTGRSGIIVTYYPTGTFRTDYNHSAELRARYRGEVWTEVVRGVATGEVHHVNGLEYVNNVQASGSVTLYRNGKRNNGIELTLTGDAERYFCSGNTASFNGAGYVSTWARVLPPAPSPDPAPSG